MGCTAVQCQSLAAHEVGGVGKAAGETGPHQEKSSMLCSEAQNLSSKMQESLKELHKEDT